MKKHSGPTGRFNSFKKVRDFMTFKRAMLIILTAACVLFGMAPAAMAEYHLRLEATGAGTTSKTAFSPGDELYVKIVLDNAADVAGCAFTLNYPVEFLLPPETDSEGKPVTPGEITSTFPFSFGSTQTHLENSSESGRIFFTGAAIDTSDGGGKYESGDVALFRVLFRVKEDAASENFSLSLTQTELFDLDAGYGVDHNGNGLFDQGTDEKQKVSLLVGAVNHDDANWDNLSMAFPVLLDELSDPVELNLIVVTDEPPVDLDSDQDGLLDHVETNTGVYVDENNTGTDPENDDTDGDGVKDGDEVNIYHTNPVKKDTDGDGMPDGWEIQYRLDPLVSDASADTDKDGITDLQEYCLGTDPTEPAAEPNRITANAGSQQTVGEGVTVVLNGLNSHALNGTVDSYEWVQTTGSAVELSDPSEGRSSFVAPDVGSNGEPLLFKLTVHNGSGTQSEDMTIINVTWANTPPSALAGNDQTVAAGDVVTLNGADSTDSNGGIASYQWTQVEGTEVELSDPMAPRPTFTAPDLCLEGESLVFRLVVTDTGGLKALDTCVVNVSQGNAPPTAVAGDDQTAEEGSTVTLNGADSTDADGGISSYRWAQVKGHPVTLSNPTSPTPTFVAPPVQTGGMELVFMLITTDEGGLQGSDRVSVLITDNHITGFSDRLTTLKTSTNKNIGFQVQNGGDFVYINPIAPSDVESHTNMPEDFVYGLFGLKIKTDIPGGIATITVSFPAPAPEDYTWFKYISGSGWTDFSSHARFNSAREEMTLTLVDGGIGDDDGEADGTIIDPSGLALMSSTGDDAADDAGGDDDGNDGDAIDNETSTTTGGDEGSACFIGTALSGLTMKSGTKGPFPPAQEPEGP
jgi:hypothetical protein